MRASGFPSLASIALLFQCPGRPEQPHRYARRLALDILSSSDIKVHVESREMAEQYLRRAHEIARSHLGSFKQYSRAGGSRNPKQRQFGMCTAHSSTL